jgi:hypothetical protein
MYAEPLLGHACPIDTARVTYGLMPRIRGWTDGKFEPGFNKLTPSKYLTASASAPALPHVHKARICLASNSLHGFLFLSWNGTARAFLQGGSSK